MNVKLIIAGFTLLVLMTTVAFADGNPPSGLIDDDAAGWIWSGMQEADSLDLHGGTAHAGGPGAYGEFTFQGTGVDVISGSGQTVTINGRTHRAGKAKISIDGKQVVLSTVQSAGDTLAHAAGLKNGVHVLQIEPVGGWVAVDYIVVTGVDHTGGGVAPTFVGATGASDRRWQFEDCDYFDGGIPRPGMPGFYRPGNISVEPASDMDGGYDVANIRTNEWFEWERVPAEGHKRILVRVACWAKDAQLHLVIDGAPQPPVTLPVTGDFQAYTTVNVGAYYFGDQPVHTIRIVSHTQDAMNLNWWQVINE